MKARDRLALGRVQVMKKAPYWTDIVYSFVPIETNEVDTLAVTAGLVLFYNPKYVESIPQDSVAAAMAHEICHVILRHMERLPMNPADPLYHIAALAADLPINTMLEKGGWAVLPDWAYPRQFGLSDGHTQEQYFEALKNMAQKVEGGGGKHGLGCGSCMKKSTEGMSSEAMAKAEAAGRNEVSVDRLVQSTLQSMANHIKSRGSIPGFSLSEIELALQPARVAWQQELSYAMRKAAGQIVSGGSDLSKARPSKRSYTRGILIPGLIHRALEVAFVVDTSGSMGATDFVEAVSESADVASKLQIHQAWLLHADTDVAFCQRLPVQAIKMKREFHGRGGTDFTAAVERLTKLRPRPQLALYYTDGYGGVDPTPPPGIHVIWVVTTSGGDAPDPPYGQVVRIPKQ